MDMPIRHDQETPLKGVRSNIVQSIRAYRVSDLQEAAQGLGHHFLYANLAQAQSKQDVLDLIGAQFTLPSHFGKNFDALYDWAHSQASSWCWSKFPPTSNLTRKPASNCWTSSATPPITGETGRYPSDASILFCSPFCAKQPSRTGD
jgi:hypothetical protein